MIQNPTPRTSRETIIAEIQRIAQEHGRAPGMQLFEAETQIGETAWRGVFWARWGDALIEAGFEANTWTAPHEEELLLERFAEATRHYKKLPTDAELRLYARTQSNFPNVASMRNRFGGKVGLVEKLAAHIAGKPEFDDIRSLVVATPKADSSKTTMNTREGFVYLLRSGANYKIGRSDQLERRVKSISIALPDRTELVHSIRTDDPPGIEAYWHRRFADQRANGEWFKLSATDIAAFKRRKYQ